MQTFASPDSCLWWKLVTRKSCCSTPLYTAVLCINYCSALWCSCRVSEPLFTWSAGTILDVLLKYITDIQPVQFICICQKLTDQLAEHLPELWLRNYHCLSEGLHYEVEGIFWHLGDREVVMKWHTELQYGKYRTYTILCPYWWLKVKLC